MNNGVKRRRFIVPKKLNKRIIIIINSPSDIDINLSGLVTTPIIPEAQLIIH